VLDKLRSLVGAPRVLTGVDCSPYALDGRAPEAVVFPGSQDEVATVVAHAAEAGVPITPWGGGTRMGIGSAPPHLGIVLGLSRVNRVVEHEPGDLTATVETGITLDALQAELGRRGQWLSLDPATNGRSTIGGVVASNASGPRRHLYGTMRDLLIGVRVVTGEGLVVRGGGKVVKNVAGYDVPKLFVGSFGTLGVLVEVTVKLRPRPDEDRLVVARFDRVAECGEALRALMASDLVPSALELLDPGAAVAVAQAAGVFGRGSDAAAAAGSSRGAEVWLGVDGIRPQVEWQCAEVERILRPLGLRECGVLDGEERDAAWRALGELPQRAFDDVAGVLRCAALPAQVAELAAAAAAIAERHGLRAAVTAHAGVGALRAVVSGGGGDAAVVAGVLGEWRALVQAAGGHAVVEWAPLAVKERVAVWDEPGPAFRLMKAIKDRLDPHGIMNPGRFVGEI
jgi:glycolate oxidase FAD binding subunit